MESEQKENEWTEAIVKLQILDIMIEKVIKKKNEEELSTPHSSR